MREQILGLVERYAKLAHAPKPFVSGKSPVPVSGKVYGAEEMRSLVDASLDFWLTTGRFNDAFEATLAQFLGRRFALTCNSGSSANLVAMSGADLADAGQGTAPAGRRSDHLRNGFSDHGQSDDPEPPYAGIRRCRHSNLQYPSRYD